MKKIFILTVLFFSLQSWTNADDIKDFEIEGISIGDSALEFFSKEQLDNTSYSYSKNDKYLTSYFFDVKFQIYDAVEVSYLKKDKKYIIAGLSGGIVVQNINECKKINKEIAESLSSFFSEAQSLSDEGSTPVDDTGKSKYFRTSFKINPKSNYFEVESSCIFYYGEAAKKFTSNAGISIKTDKLNHWLSFEAYN